MPGCVVLNDVVLNQVLFRFGSDAETEAVLAAVQGSGEAWMSLGGTATLAALVPLALAPAPQAGGRLTRGPALAGKARSGLRERLHHAGRARRGPRRRGDRRDEGPSANVCRDVLVRVAERHPRGDERLDRFGR